MLGLSHSLIRHYDSIGWIPTIKGCLSLDLIDNAKRYHTAEETDSILRNYLKEHGNEEGCSLCFIQEGALPSKVLKQLIPQPIFTGRMKDIAELLMVYLRSEERQNK